MCKTKMISLTKNVNSIVIYLIISFSNFIDVLQVFDLNSALALCFPMQNIQKFVIVQLRTTFEKSNSCNKDFTLASRADELLYF